MDVDDVLLEIGEFGKYQKLVIWLILLPSVFPCGFHAYNQLFMAATPNHRCRVSKDENDQDELTLNASIPFEFDGGSWKLSQCEMFDKEVVNNTLQYFVNNESLPLVPCKHGWVYDTSLYEETVVTEWNLVCEKDFMPTLALVLLGVGGFVGSYIFGYIQDGAGRKPAFFIYLLILCFFGIATAFATNFFMWAAFRAGVGISIPAILGSPYVLAVELVGPSQRTLVTILVNIAYSIALVSLSFVAWFIRDWRSLALATTLPFLGFFVFWWYLPESPRWLLAQGKFEEADKILRKIAKVNGQKLSETHSRQLKNVVKKSNDDFKYGILDLFRTPNLRLKTTIITFIWFTNTSVYVGLSYYAPSLGGDEILNFFLAGAVELPTYLFLWPALERWGRRWTLCVSMVIGGTACLATFLARNDSIVTLGLYCVGKMGISSSFVVLPLMASELYPTVVRGLGMSISSVVGMLGPIFIPLINYLKTEMIALPLIIMGTMLVVGGSCSLLLPETLNKHLPQTLQDGESTGLHSFTFYAPEPDEPKKININVETSL